MSVTALAPATVVPAPPRTPLSFGLFSVFSFREGAQRWENGVGWTAATTEMPGGIGRWAGQDPEESSDERTTLGLPKDFSGADNSREGGSPFTVYGHFQCSPVGMPLEDIQNTAQAHLINREEARVEQTLWTGDLGNDPNFTDAAVLPAGTDEEQAIAVLEQWLAVNYGSLGVLHMDRYRASLLLSAYTLESKNGRLFTKLGTPVVAGSGYVDNDTIVATGALVGYRSDIFTSSNRAGDLMNRGTNDVYSVAERTYVIGVDGPMASISVPTASA